MPKRRHPAPSLLYIYIGATTTTTTTPYHRSTTLIVTHPQNRQMSPKALINLGTPPNRLSAPWLANLLFAFGKRGLELEARKQAMS